MGRPKKIHHFKVIPFKNEGGTQSWRVTGTKPDGNRVRKNYGEKAEALQMLADLEAQVDGPIQGHRMQRTRLTHDELADAEAALTSLAGRSLSRAIAHYLSLEARMTSKGIDLDVAIGFAESHYRSEIKSVTVLNAYDEFIGTRQTTSQKTNEHYTSSLKLLLSPNPNKLLHTFSVSDIEAILARYKNVNSKRTYRQAFSSFFNWAVRHHYCPENPCKRLDKLPKDLTQIAVLSLDETKRLLYAAMVHNNGVAAAPVAIGLFAGLRPSEIADLNKSDIGKKVIRVAGGKLRRKLKRTVPVAPLLALWLKKFPFSGLPEGWDYKMKALKKVTDARNWVQDIIRHTSISFQTERDQNEALTAYNCGTSIGMMNQHYRNSIDDDSTITAFWELTPEALLASPPKVELPKQSAVAWPPKSELEVLVWEKPLVHAAAAIGVSDVALRKYCLKCSIDLPTPGHWARNRYKDGGCKAPSH